MIFIIFLSLVQSEITTKLILIIAIGITFEIKADAVRINIVIISFMIFPVHHFTIIRTPFTTILFEHGAVRN